MSSACMAFAPASNRVSSEPKSRERPAFDPHRDPGRESRGDEQRRKRNERSEAEERLTHESSFREGF